MNDIRQTITGLVEQALKELDIPAEGLEISLEHPADLANGDYSTNIALVLGKKNNRVPKELAAELVGELIKQNHKDLAKIETAGPGFINFYLSPEFLMSQVGEVIAQRENFGKNKHGVEQKVVVEYTDPNPFKLFHIGHLMSNTIGETISRIFDFSGAEVKRACYQGDVGMHVAKALWGMKELEAELPDESATLAARVSFLGDAYKTGANAFEMAENLKQQIGLINKEVYERSDEKINHLYDLGKKWSLEYFDEIYEKLGTSFDYKFFESETGKFGKEVVEKGLREGVFEESDGAVVFKGEKHALHTRVFLNSEGLPTYEAKELGLAKIKYDTYPYSLSVVVTGNEINQYFIVLLKVMSLIFPDLAAKTKHIGHGMLRLPTGKMSSRTGDVLTAEDIITEVEAKILPQISPEKLGLYQDKILLEQIAVGAIKYSILRQDIGKDIIFDFDTSLSFSGNSGPYLQYTYARTQSILAKAKNEGVKGEVVSGDEITVVEKMLYRFPEVVEWAGENYAPHHIATYLYELASAFSSYYGNHQIVSHEATSPYRVALTEAVGQVLKNGLNLLGISAPTEM